MPAGAASSYELHFVELRRYGLETVWEQRKLLTYYPHFIVKHWIVKHWGKALAIRIQSKSTCDTQNIPGFLVRVAVEIRKRPQPNRNKTGTFQKEIQLKRKEETHQVLFFRFASQRLSFKSPQVITDFAEVVLDIELS